MNDWPQIGELLPNSHKAFIDEPKIRRYSLDLQHPVGQHKAIVFQRALGIELEDWEDLRDEVLAELPLCRVSKVSPPQTPEQRYTWEVLVPIRGKRDKVGRRLLVITAWEMIEGRPELKSIRVAPKGRQPAS